MKKQTPSQPRSLQQLQAYTLDRTQQTKLKGGQGDFIIIDDVEGL